VWRLEGNVNGRRLSAGLVLLAAIIGGCSNGSGAARNESAAAGGVQAPAQGGSASGGKADSSPQQQQAQVAQPGVDRKLIRTATLELAAQDVVGVSDRARGIAVALGGFSGQEDVKADSASITLRVPGDQFDKAIGQLSGLVRPEDVKSRSTSTEDVTEQLVDVQSRVATQQASVDRVRALMARAQSVSDIVSIESEVTRREADLESLERRRDALSGQVALSTITVRVTKGGSPAPSPPAKSDGGILGGLSDGWHAFLAAGGAVLRVLATTLPFLIVLGIPGWFAARWWWRRRRLPRPALARETTEV
jgi:hypothetical protein